MATLLQLNCAECDIRLRFIFLPYLRFDLFVEEQTFFYWCDWCKQEIPYTFGEDEEEDEEYEEDPLASSGSEEEEN